LATVRGALVVDADDRDDYTRPGIGGISGNRK
jgi:hypothetical protein